MKSLSWVDKYKPKNINDIIGNKNEITKIYKWLNVYTDKIKPYKNWKNGLLISGPPGIGKTSLAHIILKDLDYNIIEFNASELRTSKLINEKINTILSGKSVQMMFNKNIKTAIILDEIDGMESKKELSSNDISDYINYNYNKKLAKYKKNKKKYTKPKIEECINSNPIICICNTITKSINPLIKNVLHVKFNSPSDNDLLELLKKINKLENLNINDVILNLLVPHCQNDLRRTIYILEYLSTFIKKRHAISNKDIVNIINNLGHKDMDIGLYEAIKNIFFVYDNTQDVLINSYNTDTNFVPFIVHENFINFVDKNTNCSYSEKIDICIKYYDFLTDSQILKNQIFGQWFVNDYIGFLTCYFPNLLIKNSNLKDMPVDTNIQKSALISKYNYRYYNLKSINFLSKKMSIDLRNFQIFAGLLLDALFNSKKTIQNYIDFFNEKNITYKEFEKILKLTPGFEKFQKNWTKKYQKELMSKFTEN